ncbi:tripartite tricarboxylate transporter permease [Tuberibacillus sp. Marseille-P3662]|uniref:tripartite tricarboxylate transporter permease n=1 Tax=Tuberibacillus sp. Marseille-P3662 TaxID=1965358 RepID=UPI000A1CA910|nr:tripartite tricarboxylate transporter permease [Tuberibacillus sp. Marseille-P3662]
MDYFLEVLQLNHLTFIFLGVLVGIIVGSLPGLTPTMGVALCIPFTFPLDPINGLLMIGGIFFGSVYGGSYPAVLFNVPGAPASVATTFDGYPMAKKGLARKCLEIGTMASFIGGLFGICLLLFFSPILTQFALQFGPAESFWLAILGITLIATLSQGSVMKDLLGACLGIAFSFIGISVFSGTSRFTFGLDALTGGFHVVAVLVGLFAFPQALNLLEELHQRKKQHHDHSSDTTNMKPSSIRQSLRTLIKHRKSLTIGSIIGGFVGILPGAGGNIASVAAYSEAKRSSRNKHLFGKGHPEGIVASESANNALVGGSLIPLLTLGIPGSPTAAIFLGGILIHGIWPGRSLFVNHADVAYPFLYGMLLVPFATLIFGLALIPLASRLVRIPSYYMAPMIISFCIIGAYATQNSLLDVYSMVLIGIGMYILHKYQFEPAPIALGFILGPIAEQGLLQGIAIGQANGSVLSYFTGSYWNLILIAIIGLSILKPMIQARKHLIKHWSDSPFSPIKGLPWFVFALIMAGALLFVSQFQFSDQIFPQIVFASMLLLSLMLFMKTSFNKEAVHNKIRFNSNPSFYALVGVISVISLMMNLVGFYIQALLLMAVVPLYYKMQRYHHSTLMSISLIAAGFTCILFVVFTTVMNVPLPTSIFLYPVK